MNPSVKSVKEKDVVAALGKLRDLLQGDVGVAAQVLKALVGDVILDMRQVEGQAKPKEVVVPLKRKCHRAGGDPPVTPPTDSQPEVD